VKHPVFKCFITNKRQFFHSKKIPVGTFESALLIYVDIHNIHLEKSGTEEGNCWGKQSRLGASVLKDKTDYLLNCGFTGEG